MSGNLAPGALLGGKLEHHPPTSQGTRAERRYTGFTGESRVQSAHEGLSSWLPAQVLQTADRDGFSGLPQSRFFTRAEALAG